MNVNEYSLILSKYNKLHLPDGYVGEAEVTESDRDLYNHTGQ